VVKKGGSDAYSPHLRRGLTLLGAVPAFADQVLDLSTIECHQFTAYNTDNGALIVTYLEAYYLGDNDPPVLNFTKMTSDTKKLLEFCTANPTVGLITAADKLTGKSK
jgi:acid stress chaperone HdeB